MSEDFKAKVNNIRQKISGKVITINRVPKNTYDRFMELATEDDFCKDYGMVLKYLLDFYFGIIPSGIEHLEVEIEMLKEEIAGLKSMLAEKKEEKVVRKTLSGKEI